MSKRSAETAESFTEPGESKIQRVAFYKKESQQDNSEWRPKKRHRSRPRKRHRSRFDDCHKTKTEIDNDGSSSIPIKQDELNWNNQIAIGADTCNDHGCKVTVRKCDVKIQDKPTTIDESSTKRLSFLTPKFKAKAKVEMAPLSEGEEWRVGWIQACTDNFFRISYGNNGYCTVDFPELRSGEQVMVNDCVGNHYPWYKNTATFTGTSSHYQSQTITMNDALGGTARYRWHHNNTKFKLTQISRYNSFNVWLVAWDMTFGKAYILKTFYWDMNINIDIDVKKPLGQRTKVTSVQTPTQPKQVENLPIPRCALVPPNANRAFSLFFCPRIGDSEYIIPSRWSKNISTFKQIGADKFDYQLCHL